VGVDPRTEVSDAAELRALWTGVLLPPIVLLIDLEVAYALVPRACASRNSLPVHLSHLICLALVLFAGITALRCWRALGSTWPGEDGSSVASSRFLAGLGLLLSALSALVIIAMWIPSFMLDPCQ
jgi:hypothetical protein